MPVARWFTVLAAAFVCFAVGRGLVMRRHRPADPRVQVSPASVALGSLRAGELVERTVELRNTGGSRLLIVEVRSTCHCTVGTMAEQAVAPGASVAVRIAFQSETTGHSTQSVLIETNDPVRPLVSVEVTADVIPAPT